MIQSPSLPWALCLAVVMSLPPTLQAQSDAEAPNLELPPVVFYPAAHAAYSPPPDFDGTAVSVEVVQNDALIPFSEPFTASSDADGIFRFKVVCMFVGLGRIIIRDPVGSPSDPPLSEIPLRCHWSAIEEPEQAPLSLAVSAAVSGEENPAPPGISGRIESLSNKTFLSLDDQDIVTFTNGDSRTFTQSRSGFLETTLSGGQRCQSQNLTGERCCFSSNPDDPGCINGCTPLDSIFTVCEPAPILPTMEDLTVAVASNFSLSRTTTTLSSTTEESAQSQSRTEWTITWVFPEVEPDQQIEALDILAKPVRPLNSLDITGLDQFLMFAEASSSVLPEPTGSLTPVSPAACPGTRFRTSGLRWRLPGPELGTTITTKMVASPGGCTTTTDLSGGSGSTQITGSQTLSISQMIQPSVSAKTARAPLMVVAESPLVAPRERRKSTQNPSVKALR